jgi:chromatin segregation and condensation protein Rec8/ScpA/Scc1 (kleisin family)
VDAADYIVAQHREMEQLLGRLEAATAADARTELLRDVTAHLARHMAIEERVLFPAVRAELCDVDPETFGDDVLENLEEHHVLKTLLDELHDMDPTDERFAAKAGVLSEQVEHHHEEEEEGVLAGIREHWSATRRAEVGRELDEAEASAPTRAHPSLPDEGRFVEVAQRFAATIDEVRDAARKVTDATTR